MDRSPSPGHETMVEPTNPVRKSAPPKAVRPKVDRAKEGAKQEALVTSPSDSGDQASRLQARPPSREAEGHQPPPAPPPPPPPPPPPYYPVLSPVIPHFVAGNEIRGGPMYPMPIPPPSPMGPVHLEHVSMGPAGPAFCDMQDRMNQPYCDPQLAEDELDGIKAVVEKKGYISLHLRYDAQVDIAPNQAIRIVNHRKGITLALSGCATQMSLVHPQGRVLQYNSRIEIQTEDFLSIKNAKMWPRGVSFTANNCALVYLVDQAGARSTTDTFHDLYADNIADTVFLKSCQFSADHPNSAIAQSINYLERADYWRTESDLDCWLINDVNVKQTPDGLVSVERKHGCEMFTLKTSPSNGKARLQSSFLYLTASMGEESHIFVKSNDRRLHYNGHAFVVRNAGHSAGFDESGLLRIW